VYEGKKERNLFTRASAEDGAVSVRLGSAAKDASRSQNKMKALVEVGARPNQLFLTEIVNLDDPEAQGPHFPRAITWFRSMLQIIEADARFTKLAEMIAADERFVAFASRFLQDASTGIANLEVHTDEITRSAVAPYVWDGLVERVREGDEVPFLMEEGQIVVLSRPEQDAIKVDSIEALHESANGKRIRFPLHEESDGTQRLLNLLPALQFATRLGCAFVIDELERSMHPMLARKFVDFFLKAVPNLERQLIFATHESTLLDLELVRRDGIWFTEKDPEGATHLYSLADFKVRKDLRIDKGYFQGRFGAVPFLGGIDRLMEEQAAREATA
jgi:hypothetical protein